MATDYGYDASCDTDLTPTLLDVSGERLLAQVCCRRLYTPNASLLSAPDEKTTDLREFLSSTQGLSSRDLNVIRATATGALMADPRIFSVTINTDWDPTTGLLGLRITGQGSTGPFQLTLAVSAVTVQVLSVGAS